MVMVRTTYYVESDMPIEKAAKEIAAEQSTGTWTTVPAEREVHENLGGRVVSAEKNTVVIDFPAEIFEPDNCNRNMAPSAHRLGPPLIP
jgi:ribulose-bisphosphate carboxylase large chain